MLASTLFGQSFEVASVKLHQGPMHSINISTSGQRLNAEAANLVMLIMYAYHVPNYRVVAAEKFTDANTRYDIVAKASGTEIPPNEEFRRMLQTLLADRFQLKLHREAREMPVYELVVGKNGPKFKQSAPGAEGPAHYHWTGRNDEITIPKGTMDDVVGAISNAMLDRPVIDKTGLTGTYAIKLTYTPDVRPNRESDPDLTDISVFSAVQEQLGLRLDPGKAMVEVLVVDGVKTPTEN